MVYRQQAEVHGRPHAAGERSPGWRACRGKQVARWGVIINLVLVLVKLISGILGHAYALVADAIESFTDVVASLVVWAGMQLTARPADESYPYGYGRAEPLTAAVVSLMLLGAAVGVAVAAVREIMTPHHLPAPFTLGVLAAVMVVKELLFRWVWRVADETSSVALEADAWHHRSDALTSAAAFVGIALAVLGGPGWEAADDWAALIAAAIIASNGWRLLYAAVQELMDRQPPAAITTAVLEAAAQVPGVLHLEKLRIRRLGGQWFVDLHVQADPHLSLEEAHRLSGRVKEAIRQRIGYDGDVLIHMEPYEQSQPVPTREPDV
ncbi:MAG: cation transporter [Planctomycetaceae bacterium]|nr:MAG: cation transporter [Planctomycetaceae bacterium]